MTVSAATLNRIADMESPDAMREMLRVLAEQVAADEHRKELQRERTRKHRDLKRYGNVTVTLPERDSNVTSPRQEGFPPPPFEETHPPQKGTLKGSQKGTPFDALAAVLDETRARGVVEHRQRIGKALTPYAAALLAKKLAEWPDANEAADAMIANGWQGFKPEWMERRNGTGPPRQRGPSFLDIANAADAFLKKTDHDDQRPPYLRIAQ